MSMHSNSSPLPAGQRRAEQAKLLIEAIERRDLDQTRLGRPPIDTLAASDVRFRRVVRMPRFWEDVQGHERLKTFRIAESLTAGMSQQRASIIYRIWNDGQAAHVSFGSSNDEAVATIEALLIGLYPGVGIVSDDESPSPRTWTHVGMLSGIPFLSRTGKDDFRDSARDMSRIDQVLRGNPTSQWCFLVIAEPISREARLTTPVTSPGNVREHLYYPRDYYLEMLSELASATRRQNSNFDLSAGDMIERVDRVAQHNMELLERELERAECARSRGLWDVQVYFGAPDRLTFLRLQALVRAAFASDAQATQSLRLHIASAGGHPIEGAKTALTSDELASYFSLPREEFRGYQVIAHSRYGVTPPIVEPRAPMVQVGSILDGANRVGYDYQLNLRHLARHVLVAGTTGTGKTNTCLYLLTQLAHQRIPFLVIEPVNARLDEYRALARLTATNQPDYFLRIFSLGDENIAPFPINPLEIVPGDTVDAHISRLMTCFKAAMPMWQPLPAVFLSALQRTYAKAGLLPGQRVQVGQIFPSLHDFSAELTYVAEHEIEHGGEARQNILGASTLRIRALITGSAGRTLTARLSLPLEELLHHPTIIELRHIGDDSDKALVIALILMRLMAAQEHGLLPVRADGLSHVLLIEEAHRLLSNQQAGSSENQENTRGEAAQTFAHLLAETRKYGQSIVIAEQMPQKLVRDAIGNTGLKIVHGLSSYEDREALASAMRLNDQQREALAALQPGEAVAYVQGEEAAVRIAVPRALADTAQLEPGTSEVDLPSDSEVRHRMDWLSRTYQPLSLPFRGCDVCRAKCIHRGLGEGVSRLYEVRSAIDDCLSRADRSPEELLSDMLEQVEIHGLLPGVTNLSVEMRYCIMIHLLYRTTGASVDMLGLWRAVRRYLDS